MTLVAAPDEHVLNLRCLFIVSADERVGAGARLGQDSAMISTRGDLCDFLVEKAENDRGLVLIRDSGITPIVLFDLLAWVSELAELV